MFVSSSPYQAERDFYINLDVIIRRSARGDGVRLGHQGHGYLRPADDVHHHAAYCLLHRLGLWRWDHADAILATHQVSLPLYLEENIPYLQQCSILFSIEYIWM